MLGTCAERILYSCALEFNIKKIKTIIADQTIKVSFLLPDRLSLAEEYTSSKVSAKGCQTQGGLGTLWGYHGQQRRFSSRLCHHSPWGNNHSLHSACSHDRALHLREKSHFIKGQYSPSLGPCSFHYQTIINHIFMFSVNKTDYNGFQTWEKQSRLKRCFNENMIRKQLLVNIQCYYLLNDYRQFLMHV